jgi:hypothetical protein
MLWRDMIQDSEFSPFKDFILGVQERRAQSEHGGQMVMIRGCNVYMMVPLRDYLGTLGLQCLKDR